MRRCLAELVVVVVVLGATPAVHAESRDMAAPARLELVRGQALFTAGDYASAIATYEAGFAIDPHPDFLYAKGQAQRMNGDCPGAIQSYQGFLASSPPEAESKLTRYNIARCEATIAAARQAPVTRERERGWYRDPIGGVLAGGAVVALGAGTALLVIADGHVDRANDAPTLGDYYNERYYATSRRRHGAISLVTGGALAIGAVLRYALHRRPRVEVTAAVTSGGAAIVLGGRF